MPKVHVPKPSDRPDVEVLIDGAWCQGELRMWARHDDGTWTAQVQYQPPDGDSGVIRTFSADDVREDAVDRPAVVSRGRPDPRCIAELSTVL
jgi:hypothetical protein